MSRPSHPTLPRHLLPAAGVAALVLCCVVWGSAFPVLKVLTAALSAPELILLRFAGGALCLLPLARAGFSRSEWRWGLILGVVLFLAFWLQIEGLARTTSNRNAFITGLNVLAVPVMATALGQRPAWSVWLACAMAAAGMYLLFYQQAGWNVGDSLTAICMLLFAAYILLLERSAAQDLRVVQVTVVQGFTMGVLSLALLALRGQVPALLGHVQALSAGQWGALLYLMAVASALVPAWQIWGQRYVSAVHSALIFGLEPVFAALFAYVLIGERLQGWAWLGAALVVLALLWAGVSSARQQTLAQGAASQAKKTPNRSPGHQSL